MPESNPDETFDLPAPVSIQSQPLEPPKESTPQPQHTPFSASLLTAVRRQSCLRNNFAANLVRNVFSAAEMRVSNVRGVLGKQKLDPQKIEQIQEAVFQVYPCGTGERCEEVWRACSKAIDE